jgi:hypothetical protein
MNLSDINLPSNGIEFGVTICQTHLQIEAEFQLVVFSLKDY